MVTTETVYDAFDATSVDDAPHHGGPRIGRIINIAVALIFVAGGLAFGFGLNPANANTDAANCVPAGDPEDGEGVIEGTNDPCDLVCYLPSGNEYPWGWNDEASCLMDETESLTVAQSEPTDLGDIRVNPSGSQNRETCHRSGNPYDQIGSHDEFGVSSGTSCELVNEWENANVIPPHSVQPWTQQQLESYLAKYPVSDWPASVRFAGYKDGKFVGPDNSTLEVLDFDGTISLVESSGGPMLTRAQLEDYLSSYDVDQWEAEARALGYRQVSARAAGIVVTQNDGTKVYAFHRVAIQPTPQPAPEPVVVGQPISWVQIHQHLRSHPIADTVAVLNAAPNVTNVRTYDDNGPRIEFILDGSRWDTYIPPQAFQ